MGLGIFNKLSAPIVLKEDSNAEEQLRQMEYYPVSYTHLTLPTT